jgi:pyruvate dehydrogenase E1 component beta subunit
MKYSEAVKVSMENLSSIDDVRFMGYNLKYGSMSYGSLTRIDPTKIIELPVAEQLMAGLAIGMSLQGFLPVLIFERHDFLLLAADQLINHLSKIRTMSKGEFAPKVIIRAIVGGTKPFHPGPQHTQNFTDLIRNHTTFAVYEPETSEDVISAYTAAMDDPKSSFISEARDKYGND